MIGSRNGIMLFTIILVNGQVLFMIGGYESNYTYMLIGRILYGIGCESMYVGQSAIATEWFINFEMPFAIACCSCLPLFGSFIGGAFIPKVYNETKDESGFGDSFALGFWICVGSMLLVFLLYTIDYKTEKHDKKLLESF